MRTRLAAHALVTLTPDVIVPPPGPEPAARLCRDRRPHPGQSFPML